MRRVPLNDNMMDDPEILAVKKWVEELNIFYYLHILY